MAWRTGFRLLSSVAAVWAATTPVARGQPRATLSARANPSVGNDTGPFAISHVTVVDVARGRRLTDRTVVVIGHRIARVGPSGSTPVPHGARVVDGRGAFLIPGLWDMHVHVMNPDDVEADFPTFLANGVTGVRDMGNAALSLDRIHALRAEVLSGRRAGPRFVAPGPITDGPPTRWPHSVVADTPARARALVDSLADAGADFIKVYSRLRPGVFAAIADEARRRAIPFAGHVPFTITAAEASDAGQRSMEHLYGIPEGCSGTEAEVVAARHALLDAWSGRGDVPSATRAASLVYARALEAPDAVRCDALVARLARNHTWQVPTLAVYAHATCDDAAVLAADPRMRYVVARRRALWPQMTAARDSQVATSAEAARETAALCGGALERLVGRLARGGVPLLAGTDAGNPYVLHGFSLHDELALLVHAGLTPLAALRAATLGPAMFLGATDSLGTIAPGKLADLVLLDADPLTDIRNTTRIRAVVANGRLFDRAALDDLLAAAVRAATLPAAQPSPQP